MAGAPETAPSPPPPDRSAQLLIKFWYRAPTLLTESLGLPRHRPPSAVWLIPQHDHASPCVTPTRSQGEPRSMTAELRRDLGGVGRHATVPLPAQRSPYIPVAQPSPERSRWQGRYTGAVVTLDLAAVVASAALYGLWGNARTSSVLLAAAGVVVLTAVSLRVARAWEPSVLGQGSLEFTRLLRGFIGAAVVVGLTGLALELTLARPWVFAVLPLAGAWAVAGRMALRKRVHHLRGQGRAMSRVL